MYSTNCVKAEIHNVLASLRSNQRWASKARFEREIPLASESLLLREFKALHYELQDAYEDINDVDSLLYLHPFLKVIVSDHTSAEITSVALSVSMKANYARQVGSRTRLCLSAARVCVRSPFRRPTEKPCTLNDTNIANRASTSSCSTNSSLQSRRGRPRRSTPLRLRLRTAASRKLAR